MSTDLLQYAGFWRRFAAFWLDFLVLLPLTALVFWGSEHYRLFSVYYMVPGIFVGLFYGVYLVRRFGGTPGKLIMRLRIRRGAPEICPRVSSRFGDVARAYPPAAPDDGR